MAIANRKSGMSPFRPMRSKYPGIPAVILVWVMCAALQAQGDSLKRGISLMRAPRPAEAEQVLSAIPPSQADYLSAQTLLGYLLLQRSALPEAESAFRTVLQAEPGNAPARLGLGMALIRRGSGDRAAGELEKILADPAVGVKAQIQWIHSLFLAGRIDDAIREARQMTAEHNAVAELHSLLGFLYHVRSETGEALREYRLSVQLDPGDLVDLSESDFAIPQRGGLGRPPSAALKPRWRWIPIIRFSIRNWPSSWTNSVVAGKPPPPGRGRKKPSMPRSSMPGPCGPRARAAIAKRKSCCARAPAGTGTCQRHGAISASCCATEQRWEEARDVFLHVLEAAPGDSRAVAGLGGHASVSGKGRGGTALLPGSSAARVGFSRHADRHGRHLSGPGEAGSGRDRGVAGNSATAG